MKLSLEQREEFLEMYEYEKKFGLEMLDYWIYLTIVTALPYIIGMLFKIDVFEYVAKKIHNF